MHFLSYREDGVSITSLSPLLAWLLAAVTATSGRLPQQGGGAQALGESPALPSAQACTHHAPRPRLLFLAPRVSLCLLQATFTYLYAWTCASSCLAQSGHC